MYRVLRAVRTFLGREDGPTSVEYAVMLALIIVVCVSVISGLGLKVKEVCDIVCDAMGRT